MSTKNNLKRFFTEYWKYLAVYTACKLNIFDNLLEYKDCQKLANELNIEKESLNILLDALVNIKFLIKKDNKYKINSTSHLLTDNHPESLKYSCILWGEEHLNAWQNLIYTIQTGKGSFEMIYGMSYFTFLNKNPNKLYIYQKAMNEYARDDYNNITNIIDFSKYSSIMDVGGGWGFILEKVREKFPEKKYILFESKEVLQFCTNENIQKIEGNFFEKIPVKSDAIILARVLHDWDDDLAQKILVNCYSALNYNGNLFIIENCKDLIDEDLSLLSLNMKIMCNSYERSSNEYICLAQKANFIYESNIKLNHLQIILKFKK